MALVKSTLQFLHRNMRSELEMYVRGTVVGKSIIMASFMTLALFAFGWLLGSHKPPQFLLFYFVGSAVGWIPFVLAMRAIARKLGIVRTDQSEPIV